MLNDNQKRKISATIRFLNADLSKLEKLFTGDNNIPSAARKDLIDLASLVKERSDALSEAFGFRERKEAASREALGILSALWIDLKEIKADKLRSYGNVSLEEETDFDPEIDKMMDLISEMQRILRRRS